MSLKFFAPTGVKLAHHKKACDDNDEFPHEAVVAAVEKAGMSETVAQFSIARRDLS